MARTSTHGALTFYEVEVFGPPHDGLWMLCPTCLRQFERDVEARGLGSLRIEGSLLPNEEHPRECSNCERPQLGYWSQLERWAAGWDEGAREALAGDPPF
jgi:hypothetical protein